jgi:hypothetical protein
MIMIRVQQHELDCVDERAYILDVHSLDSNQSSGKALHRVVDTRTHLLQRYRCMKPVLTYHLSRDPAPQVAKVRVAEASSASRL